MSDKFLSSVAGSSEYSPDFVAQSTASGSGTPVTITCPAGKRIRLEAISSSYDTASNAAGLVSSGDLSFSMSFETSNSSFQLPPILMKYNEDLTVTATGSISIVFIYSYGD